MKEGQPGEKPFSTAEAILSMCLYIAGCEFLDDRQPCSNLFDADILFNIGSGFKDQSNKVIRPSRFTGMPIIEAAEQAWNEQARGHVQYHFKLTARTADLIRAYREQCADIEKMDGRASDFVLNIMANSAAGAIQQDEALLRMACVILKTRGEFMALWKKMIPLLRIPDKGSSKHFDTTATTNDGKGNSRTVEAKGVKKPGFKVISLNLSPERKKKMGVIS